MREWGWDGWDWAEMGMGEKGVGLKPTADAAPKAWQRGNGVPPLDPPPPKNNNNQRFGEMGATPKAGKWGGGGKRGLGPALPMDISVS